MSGKHLASVLATLARNGALARIQAAFLISTVVEWAGWLALVVIAFERGGAADLVLERLAADRAGAGERG